MRSSQRSNRSSFLHSKAAELAAGQLAAGQLAAGQLNVGRTSLGSGSVASAHRESDQSEATPGARRSPVVRKTHSAGAGVRANTFRSRMLELSGEFEQLEAENRALRVELQQSNDYQATGKAPDSPLREGAEGNTQASGGSGMLAGAAQTPIRDVHFEVSSDYSFIATEIEHERLDLQGVTGREESALIRPSGASPSSVKRQRCARSADAEATEANEHTDVASYSEHNAHVDNSLTMPLTLEFAAQSSEAFKQPTQPGEPMHPQRRRSQTDETVLQKILMEDVSMRPRTGTSSSGSSTQVHPSLDKIRSDQSATKIAIDVARTNSGRYELPKKDNEFSDNHSPVPRVMPQATIHHANSLKVQSAISSIRWRETSNINFADAYGSMAVTEILPGYLTDRDQLDVATDLALEEDEPVGCCIIAPANKFRVSWDLVMAVFLFYELWVTPFELIFVKEGNMLPVFNRISHGITAFFCADIVLNFNTGYVQKDRTVMNRKAITLHYVKNWLLIDLVSTVPFDVIVASISGGLLRWVRFGKATKILKTLRYLRLVRSVSLLTKSREGSFEHIQKILVKVRFVAEPFKVVVALLVFSHVHGCLWGAAQPRWAPAPSLDESFERYYRSFRWAYIAITMGLIEPPIHEEAVLYTWLLELVVSFERLCFCALVGIWAVFQSQTRLADFARITKLKQEALDYLKRHQVSFNTQVQVLYILHETGNARNRQRHFRELMDNDLPLELHRKICSELWCTRLMSLGLITHVAAVADNFVQELAMMVREEVFASKAVIFRYGDAAIASYCVIDGLLVAVPVPGTGAEKIPDFVVGHWIGETALISPALRRDMTIVTKKITSLMGVPAEAFYELLESFQLMDAFEQVCKEHLWRGLCGRCGSLGDHFADNCPLLGLAKPYFQKQSSKLHMESSGEVEAGNFKRGPSVSHLSLDKAVANSYKPQLKQMKSFMISSTSNGGRKSAAPPTIHRDLSQFLHAAKQSELVPVLGNLGVHTLKDLQELDIEELQDELPPDQKLTKEQQDALSSHAIQKFIESAARSVQRQLFGMLHSDNEEHYIFLSHAKAEAGTEAALMKEEMEKILREDSPHILKNFTSPIFLDSDNLTSLSQLQATVLKSHNIVVLLTNGVLTRPWVLVEIVTAVTNGVRVLPVQVSKPGNMFEFPSEDWYAQLSNGELLTFDGIKVLHEAGIKLEQVEAALREMFRQIAVPYSPHRPAEMRKAELKLLMKRCRLKFAETGSSSKISHSGSMDAVAVTTGQRAPPLRRSPTNKAFQ